MLMLVNATADNKLAKDKYLAAKRKGSHIQHRKFGAEFLALKQERKKIAATAKEDAKYKEKYVTLYHEWKDQKKLEKVKRAEIDHDLASIKGWKEDIVKYGKDVTLENKKMKAMKESLPVQKKNLDIEYARRIIKARQTHQKQ